MTQINNTKQLIKELDNCSGSDVKGFEKILSRLNLSAEKISQIEKNCLWSDDYYTRNLINRNDKYELIFLCWQPGQSSPIHDHAGQSCWVKLLKGTCEEKLYELDEKSGKLKLIKTSKLGAAQQSYIHDDIALHALKNVGTDKMIGVHLYLNPIDNCYTYDPVSSEKKLIQTKYNQTLDLSAGSF